MHEYLKIAGAVLLPNVGGFAGGMITRKEIPNWYQKLTFPSYKPPNWAFAPVWTTLYSSMGYASYLVFRDGGGFNGEARLPLVLFGTQLALNWMWTPIFFGKHNIKGGLIDIVALTATAAACGIKFFGINKTAGYIFIPYLAWLSFATALNYSMYKLNPDERGIEGPKPSEKKQ